MKRVWRCSLCKQMCTRRENLKRHLKRLHGGLGEAILQYVLGNSILTPQETSDSVSRVVFSDEYASHVPIKPPIYESDPLLHMLSTYDTNDKLIGSFLKVMKLQLLTDYFNRSLNQNQPAYFSQPYLPTTHSFISNPIYPHNETISSNVINNPRSYDGVSGFKVEICLNCLAAIVTKIGDKKLGAPNLHECIPGRGEALERLGPEGYFFDLRTTVNKIPEFLFYQCREWANNTSGRLYLMARKIESSDQSKNQMNNIQVNHDALPFLNKGVVQSKVMLNDADLYEFLNLAKNETNALVTFGGKPGQENIKYLLTISTV